MMWTQCIMLAMLSAAAVAIENPVIGILTQELPNNFSTVLPASYVKALEASGARVVPIHIGQPQEYYENVVSKINGVIFPGGAVNFTTPYGYGEAGTRIYNIAKKLNDKGDFFPIMGVCLGYELLMFIASNGGDILTKCYSHSPEPLTFLHGFRASRLYRKAPKEIINILHTLPVTTNHHDYCVTIEKLHQYRLGKEWLVLSTSQDENGIEFISSSESIRYPFVGLQFHPEKNAYEWNPLQKNAHSRKAIYSARYFYDWMVNAARENNHTFSSDEEERDCLIYNYNPTYMGKNCGYNEQIYIFNQTNGYVWKNY